MSTATLPTLQTCSVTLKHKPRLAAKILEELKGSIEDFDPEEFEELIKKYEVENINDSNKR